MTSNGWNNLPLSVLPPGCDLNAFMTGVSGDPSNSTGPSLVSYYSSCPLFAGEMLVKIFRHTSFALKLLPPSH